VSSFHKFGAQFDAETFIASRLRDHGMGIFLGTTDSAVRKERTRQAIIAGKLDCTIVGRNTAGKAETYAALFERIYGEPLEPTAKKQRVKSGKVDV
jgi:hypothetical protein